MQSAISVTEGISAGRLIHNDGPTTEKPRRVRTWNNEI